MSACAQHLFECLNDVKLALAACLCPGVVIGQLLQRIMRYPNSCTAVFLMSVFTGNFFVTGLLLSNLCPGAGSSYGLSESDESSGPDPADPRMCSFAKTVQFWGWIVLCIVLMIVRAHVRGAYAIPPKYFGGLEDCVCAFCCQCCVAAQLMRHVGAHDVTVYSVNSIEGAEGAVPEDPIVHA